MSKPVLRSILFYIALSVGFILFDLVIDDLGHDTPKPDLAHVLFAAAVVLASYLLMRRAMEAHKRAEALLRQTRDEMESQVRARTAELEVANQALQTEIVERQRIERALRESEERYRTLFDTFPEPMTLWDRNGVLLMQNLVSARNLGGRRDDFLGKTIHDIFGEAAVAYMARMVRVIDTGTVEYQEDVVELPLGTRYFWTCMQRIQHPDGQSAVHIISYDITERKRSEETLRRAQMELAQGLRERTALEERQRLARELHDSVSQALYGISLGAHTALTLLDTERGKVLDALNYVLALAKAGITEMRALIFELRPESLELEGLVVALTKQTAAIRARHGIDVELSLCPEPDVPLPIKETLYRIAQEAMQNAIKHARPSRLDVRLICKPDSLGLEVRDNGVGFDPQAAYPGHLGLRSMAERAARAGGTLEIISVPGGGALIRTRIPLTAGGAGDAQDQPR